MTHFAREAREKNKVFYCGTVPKRLQFEREARDFLGVLGYS